MDGQVLLYKDGALVFSGSQATGKSLISGGMLVLGQDQDEPGGGFQASEAFRGLLDEVRIYDRVLSGAEIQASMNSRTVVIDLTSPTLTDVVAAPGRTHSIITWRTTEVADSQVEYGLTADYGLFSLVDPRAVETHAVTLSALQPGALYHYRVRSVDAAGNVAISPDATFTTLASTSRTGVKVAFIGDQGLGPDATAVLRLIRDEGAEMILHQGDFDYADNPDAWDQQIDAVLGPNFPYFASIGNHDTLAWLGYQKKLAARLSQLSNTSCIHNLGVQSTCIYKGLLMVFTASGVRGVGHDAYIRDQLAQSNFAWRISSWHKNQRLMQVGTKGDRTGWGVYEESRKGGAIVATGHAHSYERTHLMSSFQNQEIASTASTLQIEESKSFVFVSGLGGRTIRGQTLVGPWWASVYTSDQGANYGALFCTFRIEDHPNRASCYFKDIDGRQPDQFEVISAVANGSPSSMPPVDIPGLQPEGVVNAASFRAGAVAPGQIVSIFGTGLGPSTGIGASLNDTGGLSTFVGDTRVFFDGVAAALLFVRSDQLNVQVPYSVAGRSATVLQVFRKDRATDAVTLPIGPSAPGIFTVTGGVGHAAALNQDGSPNSPTSPARVGDIVTLFATGEGQTTPTGQSGRPSTEPFPRPLLPVSVEIGSYPAEVLFAAGAPGFVGLLQVNARIPLSVVPNRAVPVMLRVGGSASQNGVTIAVR